MTSNPNSSDFNYKDYSLEKLQEWVHDAMNGDASPHEIYSAIREAVREEYYYHKDRISRASGLLELMSGHRPVKESVLQCDKDDSREECKGAWTSFWEEHYYPEEYQGSTVSSVQYTDEELDAMCDKAASDEEKEKCREYNLREAEYYNQRAKLDMSYEEAVAAGWKMTDDGFWIPPQKKTKWVLPIQQSVIDGTDDYYVNFPDDLLEAANLREGDTVEWIDKGDGTWMIRKVLKPLGMEEC